MFLTFFRHKDGGDLTATAVRKHENLMGLVATLGAVGDEF